MLRYFIVILLLMIPLQVYADPLDLANGVYDAASFDVRKNAESCKTIDLNTEDGIISRINCDDTINKLIVRNIKILEEYLIINDTQKKTSNDETIQAWYELKKAIPKIHAGAEAACIYASNKAKGNTHIAKPLITMCESNFLNLWLDILQERAKDIIKNK